MGQHCGIGKGTETGVLEFAATLETAKELKSEVFISSWDLKRAFDSVDRRLLVFAWERLGVPSSLAHYKNGSEDTICIPHTTNGWQRRL